MGARKSIMCQDVFNPYFLRLSHQILSLKSWVFSDAASSGRRATDSATGGRTASPSETCYAVGTQFWFLLTILLS